MGRGDEGLGADCGEIAVHVLHADAAPAGAPLALEHLDPGLEELVGVEDAGVAALELDVLVVRSGHLHVEPLEGGREQLDAASEVDALLLHVEANVLFALVLVLVLAVAVLVLVVAVLVLVMVVVFLVVVVVLLVVVILVLVMVVMLVLVVVVVLVLVVVVSTVIVMRMAVGARRNAVVGAETAERHAQETAVAEEAGEAEPAALGPQVRVRDDAE